MSPVSSSRPLGNLEVFFKKLADLGTPLEREHWAVHLALRLRVTETVDLASYLRRAWLAVRQAHPAIGSIISTLQEPGDPGKSEVLPQEFLAIPALDPALWSEKTFLVHENETDANDLFCALRPTPTATCHWLPQSSQVCIRSSHWRLEGIGMARLGHVFMATLAEMLRSKPEDLPFVASTGSALFSIQPLLPSIEKVAQIWRKTQNAEAETSRYEMNEYSLRLEAGADALMVEFLRGVPSIGLPTRPNSTTVPPGASARVETRLSASTTANITEARRAKKLSFTGAVHAAIVRVTAKFPQRPLAKSYAAFFPVDLRQSIVSAGAASEDRLMFGLYFSGLPVCIEGVVPARDSAEKGKTFDEIAREMTVVYNRDLSVFWKAPDGHLVSLMELAEPYLQRTTVLFNTPVPEGLPLTQTPDLSGLGKVENYLRREYQSLSDPHAPKVEVSDMWIGTEKIDRCVQLHVWSWRDELRLGASFNQSFYEESLIVEELLEGLEIQEKC